VHYASDKHSRAFARYALSAAIGTFSSRSSRDPLNGSARAYARRLAALLRLSHLRSSPERSLRLACNRRTSSASRPGSGEETTSANVVRSPPASVSGSCIVRSSGTRTVGRRIATGSSEGNLPRAASRPYVDNATMRSLFRGRGYFFVARSDRPSGHATAAPPRRVMNSRLLIRAPRWPGRRTHPAK
jgi:hypothetical protein